jgi:AcrR family transcriptional regulator
MGTVTAFRARRADNREQLVRDRAARLFRQRGYHAASARDIAGAVGMLPGSLYYHFASKEDLLVAVYEEGVRRISEAVRRALAAERDPWRRLEAACVAHLETLLGGSDYAQVVIRVRPADVPGAAQRLVRLRDAYERIYRELVAALPLPRGTDKKALRLMLLGALNWSQSWYRPEGSSPRAIARCFVGLLRASLALGERQ